nr:integrase, catalytic region, zinc finger, CCHC-type, peptidase aspartic, catalytic [Tanacetum cinerariifolium]
MEWSKDETILLWKLLKPCSSFQRLLYFSGWRHALCYPTNDGADLGPRPKFLTPGTISSGFVPNIPSSTPYVPPTKNNWEILFQPMFDEYMDPSPSVDLQVPTVIAPEPAVSTDTPSSTTIDQDAPLTKQTDSEAMINSIQNGDQPLPVIAQVLLVGNAQNAPPTLKDPNNETAKDLWDALERQMRGYEYGKQDRKAAILYKYKTFKAIEGEQFLDTYLRYLQTKMLLAKKDSDKKVLLAEDQAWMESSSDSDQEINANMVFMAQIKKVLSESDESSSSAEETIAEKHVEKENQQSKDLENQNKDLQEKYDALINQVNTFEEQNNEFNEQIKVLKEKNADLLAQKNVLQDQLKINFEDDYFQEIITPDFEKIDSPFQQTSSLKPYVPNVILEKIIIDLEDEVVSLLEKEKANLKTIESLKSKGFKLSENAIFESKNLSENDCQVVKKECDTVENPKVIAPGMFKLNVSQSVSPISITPQQNGVVERRNQTLVEAARTMLTFANLPLFLWTKAIATSCFTQNHSIINKIFDKTPYELINKRKPNIKFFLMFGCRCYLLNDYEDVGKLTEKGDIRVFVGYSKESAAFRIYNKRTRKIHERSISNNMIPNVDEASTSHNVFNEHLEDAYFDASTSFHDPSIEPANVAEALKDTDWVNAMQKELDQFARLKVWRLVPRPEVPTPMVKQAKLKLDLVGKPFDHTDYQSMIGSLMYVTSCRPDIMFAT